MTSTRGASSGTRTNASASQGLTAVSTNSMNMTAGNMIQNGAANGSLAAHLSSTTQAGSSWSPSANNTGNSHGSNSTSVSNAAAAGNAQNAVSDSTSVAAQSTTDQVWLVGAPLACSFSKDITQCRIIWLHVHAVLHICNLDCIVS